MKQNIIIQTICIVLGIAFVVVGGLSMLTTGSITTEENVVHSVYFDLPSPTPPLPSGQVNVTANSGIQHDAEIGRDHYKASEWVRFSNLEKEIEVGMLVDGDVYCRRNIGPSNTFFSCETEWISSYMEDVDLVIWGCSQTEEYQVVQVGTSFSTNHIMGADGGYSMDTDLIIDCPK